MPKILVIYLGLKFPYAVKMVGCSIALCCTLQVLLELERQTLVNHELRLQSASEPAS